MYEHAHVYIYMYIYRHMLRAAPPVSDRYCSQFAIRDYTYMCARMYVYINVCAYTYTYVYTYNYMNV